MLLAWRPLGQQSRHSVGIPDPDKISDNFRALKFAKWRFWTGYNLLVDGIWGSEIVQGSVGTTINADHSSCCCYTRPNTLGPQLTIIMSNKTFCNIRIPKREIFRSKSLVGQSNLCRLGHSESFCFIKWWWRYQGQAWRSYLGLYLFQTVHLTNFEGQIPQICVSELHRIRQSPGLEAMT